jgi:tripartite-type tricarboxylate transporter receptor subunit TctC
VTTGISRRRLVAAASFIATAAYASRPAWAADYPDRTITLIAPFAPGGIVDIVARVLAPILSTVIKQSVIVVNKPGAAGIIGSEYVARARPDGYTMLVSGNGALLMGGAVYENLPYDIDNDFAPVGQVATGSLMFIVRADSPINTVNDLIAFCKANPDKATYASVASVDWLVSEFLAQKTGAKFTRVPYKSTANGDFAVASGEVLFAIPPASVVMHGGTSVGVKALATVAPQRDPGFPDAPTLVEAGIQGVSFNTWIGLLAPAKTPQEVIAKLNSSINQALLQPEAKQLFGRVDLTPAGNAPEAFKQQVVTEFDFWKNFATRAGISFKL